MSPVRRFLARHPWAQYFAVVWILAWSVAVALLLADKAAAGDRARATTYTFCLRTQGQAYAPLTPTSTEFARNDVRGAIFAYGLLDCAPLTGPLEQDRIDPEAFRPAPTPRPPA